MGRGATHKVIKGMHDIESGTQNKEASKPCEARASKIGEGGKQQTSRSSSSSSSLSFLPGGQARELAFARPRRGPIDYLAHFRATQTLLATCCFTNISTQLTDESRRQMLKLGPRTHHFLTRKVEAAELGVSWGSFRGERVVPALPPVEAGAPRRRGLDRVDVKGGWGR